MIIKTENNQYVAARVKDGYVVFHHNIAIGYINRTRSETHWRAIHCGHTVGADNRKQDAIRMVGQAHEAWIAEYEALTDALMND